MSAEIGIEQIIEINFEEKIIDPKLLQCSICFCIVSKPVECKNKKCLKVYCEACINTANNHTLNKVCPFCRVSSQFVLMSEDFYNMLSSVNVACTFEKCTEIIRLQDYKNHFKQCSISNKNLTSICKYCDEKNTKVKVLKIKCSVCSKQVCIKCSVKIVTCFNCKSTICYSCIPEVKKILFANLNSIKINIQIGKNWTFINLIAESVNLKNGVSLQLLCGICSFSCSICKKEESSEICLLCSSNLCNKETCSAKVCIYSKNDFLNEIFNSEKGKSTSNKYLSTCKALQQSLILNKNNLLNSLNSLKNICFFRSCNYCQASLAKLYNSKKFPTLELLILIKLNCEKCFIKCYYCKFNNGDIACEYCKLKICTTFCSIKCKMCKGLVCKSSQDNCYTNCMICKSSYCRNCITSCSNCNDFKVCKECKTNILKPCSLCVSDINKKDSLLCLSCWNVCNQCNKVFCVKHSNNCVICEDTSCISHTYNCKICRNYEIKKVCIKNCSFKCSFCTNDSSALCLKNNLYNSKNKNIFSNLKITSTKIIKEEKNLESNKLISKSNLLENFNSKQKYSNIDTHPYVEPLVCGHNVCEACVKYCVKCPKNAFSLSCPECVGCYYYHYCRYCEYYLCNLCSKYCKLCEESFCNSCICFVCQKTSNLCKSCFYLSTVIKCNICKIRNEICNECRKQYICSEICYLSYKEYALKTSKHLCDMFYCNRCIPYCSQTNLPKFEPYSKAVSIIPEKNENIDKMKANIDIVEKIRFSEENKNKYFSKPSKSFNQKSSISSNLSKEKLSKVKSNNCVLF